MIPRNKKISFSQNEVLPKTRDIQKEEKGHSKFSRKGLQTPKNLTGATSVEKKRQLAKKCLNKTKEDIKLLNSLHEAILVKRMF